MKFTWLKPNKLSVFLSIAFWLFDLDSVFYNAKIIAAYGNGMDYLIMFGETLLNFIIIYFIICVLLAIHSKLSDKFASYTEFWMPTKSKMWLTAVLSIVAIIAYIVLEALGERYGGVYPYFFLTLFFIAALLNVLPSVVAYGGAYSMGPLSLPSFLSKSGLQSNTGPWVYYAHYFLIIPMILLALIWNYFVSCLIICIISRFRR